LQLFVLTVKHCDPQGSFFVLQPLDGPENRGINEKSPALAGCLGEVMARLTGVFAALQLSPAGPPSRPPCMVVVQVLQEQKPVCAPAFCATSGCLSNLLKELLSFLAKKYRTSLQMHGFVWRA